MTTSTKLESYLSSLDKTLGPISVSERAEIITEIKSHVIEAQQRDASQSLDSILGSLGEPEQVANKYLLERGLKPAKPSKRPIVKWLVIGFLGTFFLTLLFIILLVFKFSPLIQINDEQERVVLLGGLIDIDGKGGSVKIGNASLTGNTKAVTGSKLVDPTTGTDIFIPFTNGKFTFSNSTDNHFVWECKIDGGSTDTNVVTEEASGLKVNLGNTGGSKCDFKIPAGVSVKASGNNVRMSVEKPKYNFDFKGNNGKITIIPDPSQKYDFDVKAVNGKISQFDSSKEKDAYKISISLVNGMVSRD